MAEMTFDKFQDLLRRLLSVAPRDEDAWAQFCAMFEPTIRLHAHISGGSAPQLQSLLDTQDLVNSVWRTSLEDGWAKRFEGWDVCQVHGYFAKAAWTCLLEKIRTHQASRRNITRTVSLDNNVDAADPMQPYPDENASTDDFLRWCYDRLRLFCHNDEEFTRVRRLINRDTTFAELARDELARRNSPFLNKSQTPEKRLHSKIETRLRRRFHEICNRFGRAIESSLGWTSNDHTS